MSQVARQRADLSGRRGEDLLEQGCETARLPAATEFGVEPAALLGGEECRTKNRIELLQQHSIPGWRRAASA